MQTITTDNLTRADREALKRLADRRDTNSGGVLLAKRMVHKSAKSYNRRQMKLADRRGDW